MALIKMVPLEEELRNNPSLRMADIKTLRDDWYQKQPHLPKISDKELALFLHSNYYLVEPTKLTINSYFTLRTHVPEFFSNRDPLGNKDIRQAMSILWRFPLYGKTKEGFGVLLTGIIHSDSSKYNFNADMKYFSMLLDYCLYTRPLDSGHVILIDLKGVTLGHAGKASPLAMKKILTYIQEGLPVRLKAIHILSTSSIVDLIMKMVKPFMKKELMDILLIHSTLESLSAHINIDILPNEYGGKAGSIATLHQESIKKLEETRAWFLYDQENNRVNEALRPGKSINEADLFGVEGSFRKLEFD